MKKILLVISILFIQHMQAALHTRSADLRWCMANEERWRKDREFMRMNRSIKINTCVCGTCSPSYQWPEQCLEGNLSSFYTFVCRVSVINRNWLLCAAAFYGLECVVECILRQGIDVTTTDVGGCFDDKKWTPLHYAAASNSTRILELIAQHGAQIDVADKHGGTPVVNAIREERDDCAVWLFNRGASEQESQEDKFASRLHFAAIRGCVKTMQYLIEQRGMDINRISGPFEFTPLHAAALGERAEAVEWLLDAGADDTIVDKDGNTAEESYLTRDNIRQILKKRRLNAGQDQQ